MWLALKQLKLPLAETRVLHFAPELGISVRLANISRYSAKDFAPAKYKNRPFNVEKFDLCTDTRSIPDASFDLILHNHVLEHIPCSVEATLIELDRILAPGGVHMFSVPIQGPTTIEDLSPVLTPQERKERFGLEDHMRVFGTDFVQLLRNLWGVERVLFDFDYPDEAFVNAAIPVSAISKPSGTSIFFRRKPIK